jgi:prolyl 4-hydroxylase
MRQLEKKVLLAGEAIVVVPGFFTPEECDDAIRLTEAHGFRAAPITTYRGFVMRPDVRNNTRVMIDDHDAARRLWERMESLVRPSVGDWTAVGLNERFRYYRYDEGQYFKRHADGAFVRSDVERSLYTAMVYLNDGFTGGATEFIGHDPVVPRRGMLLLFDHGLVHEGAAVTRGRKYVLRTDVMYRQ